MTDPAPHEEAGTTIHLKRIFTKAMKTACWRRAPTVPGRDPERWRYDAAGNIVSRRLTGCEGCLCHEYDHIIPFSQGGTTTVENCQILQSMYLGSSIAKPDDLPTINDKTSLARVNRLKGHRTDETFNLLRTFSCAYTFLEKDLDAIEVALYGDVRRPPGTEGSCRCKSVLEFSRDLVQKDGTKRMRRAWEDEGDTRPHCHR